MNNSRNCGDSDEGSQPFESDPREDVARRVFHNYLHRLKALVRWKLHERVRRRVGTSAIVQSALASFLIAHPELEDPDGLWPLLAKIVKRKAISKAREATTERRDFKREEMTIDEERPYRFSACDLQLLASGPSPEEATIFIDLIESLPEDHVQLIQWRLHGYTYSEIALKISRKPNTSCSKKTVQRRFGEIRRRLEVILHD